MYRPFLWLTVKAYLRQHTNGSELQVFPRKAAIHSTVGRYRENDLNLQG